MYFGYNIFLIKKSKIHTRYEAEGGVRYVSVAKVLVEGLQIVSVWPRMSNVIDFSYSNYPSL